MSEEGATVRVKIELDLVEHKHFNVDGTIQRTKELIEQEASLSFLYWLDSWCKKKAIDPSILEYIQAKVLYD